MKYISSNFFRFIVLIKQAMLEINQHLTLRQIKSELGLRFTVKDSAFLRLEFCLIRRSSASGLPLNLLKYIAVIIIFMNEFVCYRSPCSKEVEALFHARSVSADHLRSRIETHTLCW